MDLHECAYWLPRPGTPDRHWVNLYPLLRRTVDPWGGESRDPDPTALGEAPLYAAPQQAHPDLTDALDALCRQHPKARITPPYRQVWIALRTPPPIQLFDEITVALESGFFVGYVACLRGTVRRGAPRLTVDIHEAGYCLARTIVDLQRIQRGIF